ncbi:relaxase MobL [Aneurinibacillus thermoaerophilus]|nr:relaxase MobL [Aneurinibacillus thermoaerophilus]
MNSEDAKIKEKSSMENKKEGVYFRYMDYMGDEEKNGQLFDEFNDYISTDRKKEIAKLYSEAEQKGSPMWQDVVSFDNDWLEEQGLYDSKTHWLNEVKMKDVVRKAMAAMIEKEEMRSPVWTASFTISWKA